ncbi:MAG: hypothetical protein KME31_09100 [Tolypothrix carrinoi HA7290-LM1]|jgi:hypothetical protein|nr:hypothetical protein [Tolypothrix carrinoi HA7290-LM1]
MPHDGRCASAGKPVQRTAKPMPHDGRCASAGKPVQRTAKPMPHSPLPMPNAQIDDASSTTD